MADVQVSELPLISTITEDDMLIVNDGNVTTSIISWADALGSISRLQGQVLFDNGVEQLPSIAFVNDISTGIYNPATNEVAFVTGGTQRGVFDASGNFGVANYTPSAYNVGANNIVIGDVDLGDNGITIVSGNEYAGIINFADGTDGQQAAEGQIRYDHLDNHMGFSVGDGEAMRINFEKDVLIGTATNQVGSKLTVDGTVTAHRGTSVIPAYNFLGDGDTGFYSPEEDKVSLVTGGISQIFVDADGQLGIGEANPVADIHITRGTPKVRVQDTNSLGQPYAEASTEKGNIILDADPAQLADESVVQIRVDSEEQIRVNSQGQMIVRNDIYFNDPEDGITEAYALVSHDPVSGSVVVSADPDNAFDSSDLKIVIDGQEQVRVRSNGNINLSSNGKLTFNDDPDTYLYHPAADTLAVATAGVERLRFGELGHLLVGSTTPRFIAQNSPGLQISGNAPTASAAFMIYSPDSQGTGVHLGKSRSSTIGGVAAVQPGDQLGYVAFSGADGSSLNAVGASVAVVVDNVVGTNSVPSSLVLQTTSVGQTSPVQRLQVQSDGTVRLVNTPVGAGNALAVGAPGFETMRVTTQGDVIAQGDATVVGKVYAGAYDIEGLDYLP